MYTKLDAYVHGYALLRTTCNQRDRLLGTQFVHGNTRMTVSNFPADIIQVCKEAGARI
jgi:hypothetical protein